jgi:membrane protease subunit HflK
MFSANAVLAALRSSIRVLQWGMLAIVVAYLCSGITIVKPNEVGLIVRLGQALPTVHQAGLLFALPLPFDKVISVPGKSVQEINLDDWSASQGDMDMPTLHPIRDPYTLTGDANIIRARFVARFQVSDPFAYAFAAKDRESVYRQILYNSLTLALAQMSVDNALTTGKDLLAEQTRNMAQAKLDALGLGIHLIAFEVRNINPPSQILQAFQDVVSARVEALTFVEHANAYRASTIPDAKGRAYQIEQEAKAYADNIKAEAEGKADSFKALVTQYTLHPALLKVRLYADMLQEILPKIRISTVMPMPTTQAPIRLLLSPAKADSIESPSNVESSPTQPSPLDNDELSLPQNSDQ